MEVIFYKGTNGNSPIEKFLKDLTPADRAKVLKCLEEIKTNGFDAAYVEFRHIRKKLWEIKIQSFSIGIRIFYVTIDEDVIVLLHAYKKESQKAPLKEIEIAEKRMETIYEKEYA